MTFDDTFGALVKAPIAQPTKSPLGNAIVLQRRGMVFGASMPMITELVNDSNVQVAKKITLNFTFSFPLT